MPPLTPSEIIPSRYTVAAAASQRIIASWLPPRAPTDRNQTLNPTLNSTQTEEEEGERLDDDDLFAPMLELLGFGAKEAEGAKAGEERADERLRRMLLGGRKGGGKRGAASTSASGAGITPTKTPTKPPRRSRTLPPKHERRHSASEDEDEEGGRSSLGGGARARFRKQPGGEDGAVDVRVRVDAHEGGVGVHVEEGGDGSKGEGAATSKAPIMLKNKRRAGNYLDEVLAERARKRKRKGRGGDKEG